MRHQLQSHVWSDGGNPRAIEREGKTILHQRCLLCGRDFAQGFDEIFEWEAAYLGAFSIDPLSRNVTQRWLAETCPGTPLEADAEDREMRRR